MPHGNSKKRVLVLCYSQSGQLRRILQSLISPLVQAAETEITFTELTPKFPYPFPWSIKSFLDVMPESVLEFPAELEPIQMNTESSFNLVVLG